MADPKLKQPDLYGAGQKLRSAFGDALGAQKRVLQRGLAIGAAPAVLPAAAGGQILRGFSGAQRSSPAGGNSSAPQSGLGASTTSAPAAPSAAAPVADKPTLLAPIQVRAPSPIGAHGERVYNNETLAAMGMTPSADAAVAGRAASPTQPKPLLQQPIEPVVARPTTAPAVRDSTQFALTGQRSAAGDARADAAQFLNPMSNDAEIMRRFEISQGYGSNKGSPQARRMAGEAILGQLGARNEASATGQAGANATLQQGAQGEGVANESAAQRQLDADQFNNTSAQTTAQRLAEQQRPSQHAPIRDVSGRTSILRNDGTASTLRDEQGQPVITPAPATRLDTVSADTQYKGYADRLAAIENQWAQQGNTADPVAVANHERERAALQSQMDQLTGGQPRSGQPPAGAVEFLRANPDKAAEFDAKYGAGAAASYLGG